MALNWNGTELNITVLGDHYKGGKKVRNFKNLVETPDSAQVLALGKVLALLGEADVLADCEIVDRRSIIAE